VEVASRCLLHASGLARPGQCGHRALSFHGEQERLAGRLFTAPFIFGVDYTSTIMDQVYRQVVLL
jgi:hypothetical protein